MATSPDPRYAELHALSNFSFLRGASHPEELVTQAAALGYEALAITDECSLAGAVRAHIAARNAKLKLVIGTELTLKEDIKLVLLAPDRAAYGAMSSLISHARRSAGKGRYQLSRREFEKHLPQGCFALWLPGDAPEAEHGHWLKSLHGDRLWIAAELLQESDDLARMARLRALARDLAAPVCASGDVHMHVRERRPLQDTLTAIRLRKPLPELGRALFQNGERHLRPRVRLARLYPREWLEETCAIAARCQFKLDELRYEYPQELVPEGHTPQSWLRVQVEEGVQRRWPTGAPDKARVQIEHEMQLIHELAYEPYFLTVHDIVQHARELSILCQGRGSAANSAVCYSLGITEIDPARSSLLFERFISRERNEPPDIDVDFEHERREEVIQYIYRKYGRERAALAASVITYRQRSAIRDVGKALGLDAARVDALAKSRAWWDQLTLSDDDLRIAADAADPRLMHLRALVEQLVGFPRHLSQHVGGFVISQGPLAELVPIENAAMQDRTVIQWEKNDLESLGLLKIDVLALGMLSAIRRALSYLSRKLERPFALSDVPAEDPAVYAMLQKADSVGVFQVESRAQMSMLPRLRPKDFYDLVVQIAIVRPGPIQGDMVHPYLARRAGLEAVTYPSEAVRSVLERTLGVPIFQEQVMQLAMVAAGFTAGEADQLRRAMAAWHKRGGLEPFEDKLMAGMRARGYTETFAKQIFRQIRGFGEYGFPESHSASFALLAYASAWLKRHHPAEFLCALLNSQPMGFYGPSQLVQDAQRHGVTVLPADVRCSEWESGPERVEAAGDEDLDYLSHRSGKRSTLVAQAGVWNGPPRACGALRDEMHSGADRNGSARGDRESCGDRKARGDSKNRNDERSDNSGHALSRHAVRLGFHQVKGLSEATALRIVEARKNAPYTDVQDLASRARLARRDLEALAHADALSGLAGHRRTAYWKATGVEKPLPLMPAPHIAEADPLLRAPTEGADIAADYASTGLSLRRHPLALLRPRLRQAGMRTASELMSLRNGSLATYAGLAICRQRPGSASGVIFVTLEDETGHINVIVWPRYAEQQREAVLHSRLMAVTGKVQRDHEVLHLVAGRCQDLSHWIGGLSVESRDFH